MLSEAVKQLADAFVMATPEERRALSEPDRLAGALAIFSQQGARFVYARGDETMRVDAVDLPPESEAAVRSVGWERSDLRSSSGEWCLA